MQRFPALDPAARRVLAFSFAPDLALGDTIASASVVPVLAAGMDATPADVLVGQAVVNGDRVLQMASGRDHGNAYTLKCIASTAGGEILTLSAVVTMREGA